jgi:uncharacterized cupredoxin-like copper-binding protein
VSVAASVALVARRRAGLVLRAAPVAPVARAGLASAVAPVALVARRRAGLVSRAALIVRRRAEFASAVAPEQDVRLRGAPLGRAGALLVVAALASSGLLAGCGDAGAAARRTVELGARYSRFTPGEVVVPAGTTVRFEIRNDDPIDHEFIVGPQEVHDRHETGTEREHGAVPGEVTVPAGTTRTTEYRFDEPGTVVFACHLPGHFAYGMRGEIVVEG